MIITLVILIVSLLLYPIEAATVTCNYAITFPNTTYPAYGAVIAGVLTYNSNVYTNATAPGYSQGNPIINMTGTRSVWTASQSHPTTFSLNSSVAVTGL